MYRPRVRRAVNFIFIGGVCLLTMHIGPQLTSDLATRLTAWGRYDGEKMGGRGRSWVDLSYLSPGRLRKITFRIEKPKPEMKPFIWLQLWSALGEDPDASQNYMLKWQKFQFLNLRDEQYTVELAPKEVIHISETDRIGWSALTRDVALSSEFDSDYGCLFYNFEDRGFPKLNQNYTFDGLVQPYHFSIQLDTDDT